MCTQVPLHIEDPLPNVIFKSITLKTFHGRRIFRDWEESERMLFKNLYVKSNSSVNILMTHQSLTQ